MRKLPPPGEEFEKEYDRLRISRHSLATSAGDDHWEMQHRWMETKRHFRDSNMWIIALISSIASVLSALAAWTAFILMKK